MKQEKPIHPKETREPTQYHCMDSCNACGEKNELINPAYDERGFTRLKQRAKSVAIMITGLMDSLKADLKWKVSAKSTVLANNN